MKELVSAGAVVEKLPENGAESAETRMYAGFDGAGRVRARRRTRLTDADYAAIVKRYEDAGDVQNADIIRRQWEVARAGASNRKQREAHDRD